MLHVPVTLRPVTSREDPSIIKLRTDIKFCNSVLMCIELGPGIFWDHQNVQYSRTADKRSSLEF